MAKQFDQFDIDVNECHRQLIEFKTLLDAHVDKDLDEKGRILPFFRSRPHLAAMIGYIDPKISRVDRLAYEFDFFGDYAADLAIGDSRRGEYCFVEFEDASPGSIFRKAGKKSTLEWSPRFDHGYSQIVDWFWKLHDIARSETERARFGHNDHFDYYGLLVVGRNREIDGLEEARFKWRRSRCVVDSRHINCMTFDQLYEDLTYKIENYVLAAKADVAIPPFESKKRSRLKKRRPRFW